ncbi:MAG: acetate/propionate family kinase [Betaproteobacteria bacterium]|nr:acetate/propionate family kinase [Betaproteobacteria bacterium]MDE2122400.1 acetate/propionate family kinase [Betaproteobacteria bacterium]MDE2186252.1 acetate/propionate family kinase [Betaproteobacteria bacterium]MDE2325302.1 acetate/propionate family kinase [Betaproteobacteria bacterium]
MTSTILCINAGSSSLKFALFDATAARRPSGLPAALLRGEIDAPQGKPTLSYVHAGQPARSLAPGAVRGDIGAETAWLMAWLATTCDTPRPIAVAHRIVHGGLHHTQATRITPGVFNDLQALTSLAPLHQGPGLAGVQAAQAALPKAAQLACFDTTFHAGHTDAERRYAIPRDWHDRGYQRYGFHGLSFEAISRRLPAVLGERAQAAVLVAHLGSGASLCGLRGLRSVTTTMGFTALDGLVMGTRCGALDPGLVLQWVLHDRLSADDVQSLLYERSGLLGVSGISADTRDLLASKDPRAKQAVDLFVASIVRQIGAVSAALGGLDALVFTGGIGTHQAGIRAAVVQRLGWLGLDVDSAANSSGHLNIASSSSRIPILTLPTDEEAVMATQAAALLASAGA